MKDYSKKLVKQKQGINNSNPCSEEDNCIPPQDMIQAVIHFDPAQGEDKGLMKVFKDYVINAKLVFLHIQNSIKNVCSILYPSEQYQSQKSEQNMWT